MALSAVLLVGVLALTGAVASLVQAVAVVERGGSRASATVYATCWGALVFIPLAWGIFGGQTAWYVQAVGAYDFAGAIPFHLGAGIGALALVLFTPRAVSEAAPSRTVRGTQGALGLIALTAGWIGWLVLMEFDFDQLAVAIVANSVLLAVSSVVAAMVVERLRTRGNTLVGAAVGAVTGLSAATAACVFLEPFAAVVTGVIAGAVAGSVAFRRNTSGLSVAGFIAITGLTGGVSGLVMIGLFEPTRGFFYTGSFGLALAQLTAVVVCIVYSALVCVPLSLIAGGFLRRGMKRWAIPDSNR